MIPSHLDSNCVVGMTCRGCADAVKTRADGRWFITMGHPGFNTPANNRDGYVSRDAAIRAHRRCNGEAV